MTLSILCVTNAEPHAGIFILRMARLATVLGCEFVIGCDGLAAQSAPYRHLADKVVNLPAHDVPLQECVSDLAVNSCSGDYVLRLDDDEVVSPSLERWLLEKKYEDGTLFTFPRVYLYPDASHVLCNEGMYPDLQTRLGLKKNMLGVTFIHAGNPNGCGEIVYHALEHHKLLVKTFAQRQEIAERYEAIREGAGTLPHYARYNVPELIYDKLEIQDYTDGDYSK
jgi:hypothetical protein